MKYYVVIAEYGTGEIVKKLGPMGGRQAERMDNGANRNLNHAKYYTLILTEDELRGLEKTNEGEGG